MIQIYSEQSLAAATKRLQRKESITYLEFNVIEYPTKLLEDFIQTLETHGTTHLKTLILRCARLTSASTNTAKCAKCAVQVLQCNLKCLNKIMIFDIYWSKAVFDDIMEALSYKSSIKHLSLIRCGIDEKRSLTIAKYLRSTDASVENIDLSWNENFDDEGLAAIMTALKKHTSTKTLELSGCGYWQ